MLFRNKTPLDGGYSVWTEWSSCHANCRNTRNRTCTSPTPLFGGAECYGETGEESPGLCYGGDCCPGGKNKKFFMDSLLFLQIQYMLVVLKTSNRLVMPLQIIT